ncbi:MAG: KTSC domain-containing protein [Verrucomicrobiota bacterium]|jgi:hypothetical protein
MSYYVEMISVNSSAIRAVGYDGYTLTVEFHTGRIYDHPNVPYSVYVGLMHASSMGAYYNRYIRGRYP